MCGSVRECRGEGKFGEGMGGGSMGGGVCTYMWSEDTSMCVCVKKMVDSVCYHGEWTLVWMVLVAWPTQMNMYVRQMFLHQLGGSHQNLTFCFFESNNNSDIIVWMGWMAHFTKELYLSEVTNLFSIINTDVVKESENNTAFNVLHFMISLSLSLSLTFTRK